MDNLMARSFEAMMSKLMEGPVEQPFILTKSVIEWAKAGGAYHEVDGKMFIGRHWVIEERRME